MNLDRTLVPVSLAAAAVTGVVIVGLARLATRTGWTKTNQSRTRSRKINDFGRTSTGGCTPDVSFFIDAPIVVSDVDGSHQGLAVAMLRERFIREDEAAEPFDAEYDEAIRSCAEVTINLALNLAEAEIDDACSCGEEDCDSGAVDYEMVHLVAGRKMTEFAISFETAAAMHAAECRACTAVERRAPGYLRAQFCRNLSDDLLTNFDSDNVDLNGLPIPAAVDVMSAMLEVIEGAYGIPVAEQINRLTTGVAQSIAHKEGHEVPRP